MSTPIRILHVVGGMNRGGVETWLMDVLRHIDRSRFAIDFLVHTDQPCAYDEEIRSLGSRILSCPHSRHPRVYSKSFKRIVHEFGPYNVIHSHVHHFSGYVLWLARRLGFPSRIAHSHSDTLGHDMTAGIIRRPYLFMAKQLIKTNATCGLAASRRAASALYGPNWESDDRWRVLHCGVNLEPFRQFVDRSAVRAELGIPTDAFVIGHAGRFVPVKNHEFLVDIAAEALRHQPNIRLLLAGDGPLRPAIEEKTSELGIADKTIFAGVRSDLPRLMMGAMDAFLFPSLYEGLGLVLIEAQAAGLPCIISHTLPEEVEVIPHLMQRMKLTDSPSAWSEAVCATKTEGRRCPPAEMAPVIETTSFNIAFSIEELQRIYSE